MHETHRGVLGTGGHLLHVEGDGVGLGPALGHVVDGGDVGKEGVEDLRRGDGPPTGDGLLGRSDGGGAQLPGSHHQRRRLHGSHLSGDGSTDGGNDLGGGGSTGGGGEGLLGHGSNHAVGESGDFRGKQLAHCLVRETIHLCTKDLGDDTVGEGGHGGGEQLADGASGESSHRLGGKQLGDSTLGKASHLGGNQLSLSEGGGFTGEDLGDEAIR
eukprot:385735_1